jgi:hypothetical protein
VRTTLLARWRRKCRLFSGCGCRTVRRDIFFSDKTVGEARVEMKKEGDVHVQ